MVKNCKNNDTNIDIDSETGIMTVYGKEGKLASRKINYCPMCGRAIQGRKKRATIDAELLIQEVEKRMFENPHTDPKIRHNHLREWESMLNMIYRMVQRDV